MSKKSSLENYLCSEGYLEYKVGTTLPHEPTLFVYVIKGGKLGYVHVSYNPKVYLKKWATWIRHQVEKRLPTPVLRAITKKGNHLSFVKLYYTQSTKDPEPIRDYISRNYTLLGQKKISRATNVGVLAVSVPSEPNSYRIIKYGDVATISSTMHDFQSKCIDKMTSHRLSANTEFVEWCKRNSTNIRNGHFKVSQVAVNETPIKAMYLTAKYVMNSEDKCLNMFMPVF